MRHRSDTRVSDGLSYLEHRMNTSYLSNEKGMVEIFLAYWCRKSNSNQNNNTGYQKIRLNEHKYERHHISRTMHTETGMSSFWRIFHDWLQWKLSFSHQHPIKISWSQWWKFHGASDENFMEDNISIVSVQWNLSVTTTSIIRFVTCNLFSNMF